MALITKEQFEENLKNEFDNISTNELKSFMVSMVDIFKLDEKFNEEMFTFKVWKSAWDLKKLSFKQWKCLNAYKSEQTKNETFKSF
jgi:hypothetical protein